MGFSKCFKTILFIVIFSVSSQSWISDKMLKDYNELLDSQKIKIQYTTGLNAYTDYFSNLLNNKFKFIIDLIEATNLRASNYSSMYTNQIEDLMQYFYHEIVPAFIITRDDTIRYYDYSYLALQDKFASVIHVIISNLVEDVEDKVKNILNEIDYRFTFQQDCKNKKVIDFVSIELKKDISSIPNPRESCREKLNDTYPGIRWKLAINLNEDELYAMKKCIIMKELWEEKLFNREQKYDAYSKIFKYAGDMRCINMALNSASTRKFYMIEMVNIYRILNELNNRESSFLQ